jgi:hypothetical protein
MLALFVDASGIHAFSLDGIAWIDMERRLGSAAELAIKSAWA